MVFDDSDNGFDNALPFFEEIIIITDKDDSLSDENQNREESGLDIKTFSSPPDALYHILTRKERKITYSALLLCEQKLGDIDAALLISLLRLHPLGNLFPVVVTFAIDVDTDDYDHLTAEKANLTTLGAFAFMEHPYSMGKLLEVAKKALLKHAEEEEKYLSTMLAIEKADSEARLQFMNTWKERNKAFERSFVRFFYIPNENASYEEIFNVGKQKYYDRLFNQATHCFERSSDNESPHKADSLIYLYAIQKETAKAENGKMYLERAIDAYIDDCNWEKMQESAFLYAKDFPKDKTPLYKCLERQFLQGNYSSVNQIIDNAKGLLLTDDVAEILVRANKGSKEFPPAISAMLDMNRELKQIVYHSNYKEQTLDGEDYLRDQEIQRTLKRLEMQKQARLRGETLQMPKREVRKQERIVLNEPTNFFIDINEKAKKKVIDSSQKESENTIKSEEISHLQKKNASSSKENSNKQKEQLPDIPSQMPLNTEFGAGKNTTIEQMPTVYLEKNNSFLGDIVNMAKFTRTLYKKKDK